MIWGTSSPLEWCPASVVRELQTSTSLTGSKCFCTWQAAVQVSLGDTGELWQGHSIMHNFLLNHQSSHFQVKGLTDAFENADPDHLG